jgi:hypothetical protein
MPIHPTHPVFELNLQVAGALLMAAEAIGATAMDAVAKTRRKRVGATLHPGAATPLWNTLAAEVAPFLEIYGEQAKLARLMGVSRQHVHAWCISRTRLPDAERTLQLFAWLIARRQGLQTT